MATEPPQRRIDNLYCAKEDATTHIKRIISDVQTRASEVREEVKASIGERMAALKERQQELLSHIERAAQEKVQVLEKQLMEIQAGTCPLALPEDPEKDETPNVYLLGADAVITFKTGEDDFKDKIASFGIINEYSTYASQSFAKGPALGVLKTGNASMVWVYSCDRVGARRVEGGDNVQVSLSSPEDFADVEVEDLKDGSYKVKFVPLASGAFELAISLGPEGAAEAIRSSPFSLTVRGPTDYKQIGVDAFVEGKCKLAQPPQMDAPDQLGTVYGPNGVAFDGSGRFLFVADQCHHRVQVFDARDRKPICAYGKKGFGWDNLDQPSDVAVSQDNRVVVSDFLNHRLQVFEFSTRTLNITHVRTVGSRGSSDSCFQFPKGLAITENGLLLVCDAGNHRVQVLDMNADFKFLRSLGSYGKGDGFLSSPLDVAVNCGGEILVADSQCRIHVWDVQGNFLRAFGHAGRQRKVNPKKGVAFNNPSNLAVNDENALFVCDQGNHRILVLNAVDGKFIHEWGGEKSKKDETQEDPPEGEATEAGPEWLGLRSPAGVAVNSEGMIVVTDYESNAILEF